MNGEFGKPIRGVPDIKLEMQESSLESLLQITWDSIKIFLRLPGEKFERLKNYFSQIYVGIRWSYEERIERKFYFYLRTDDPNLIPYIIEGDQIVILGVPAQISSSINAHSKGMCRADEKCMMGIVPPENMDYKDVRVGFIYIKDFSEITDEKDFYMILAAKLGNINVPRVNATRVRAVRNFGYPFLEFCFKIADDKTLELMYMDISEGNLF